MDEKALRVPREKGWLDRVIDWWMYIRSSDGPLSKPRNVYAVALVATLMLLGFAWWFQHAFDVALDASIAQDRQELVQQARANQVRGEHNFDQSSMKIPLTQVAAATGLQLVRAECSDDKKTCWVTYEAPDGQ